METREVDNIRPDGTLIVTTTVYDHNGEYDTIDIAVSGKTYYGIDAGIICEYGRIETRYLEYSYNRGKVFSFHDYVNDQDVFIVNERIINKVELAKPTVISSKLDTKELMKDYTKKPFFPILHKKCF